MSARTRTVLLAVLALAAALRFWRLDLPFVEPYNSLSRQAIAATVVRNFYQHGFNFFYPEIDENGPGPYLFNAEMPVYSYLMAIGYKLSGGVNEWAARSVSVLFSLGTILILLLFARRTDGERVALVAALVAAVSPLNLALSRSVQPEATMLFASTAALYFFFLYSEAGRTRDWLVSACFAALAVATKIQSVVYLAPALAILAWRRDGAGILLKPRALGYAAIVALPLLWYAAMWKAGLEQSLIYTPFDYMKNRGPSDVPYWAIFKPKYVALLLKYFVFHLLTPLGTALFAIGVLARPRNRVWDACAAGTLVYTLFFWRFLLDHSYYQLPLMPVAAYYAGRGFEATLRFPRRSLAAACGALLLAASVVTSSRFYPGIYFISEDLARVLRAGEVVKRATPAGSLVVANYGGSTIQLYYCNRKGWAFDIRKPGRDSELVVELEALRARGASFFVTTTLDQLAEVPVFRAHLETYRVFDETPSYVIYDLRRFTS